jgi:uncharacterized protein YtpQ (UPF0354 family)
MRAVFALAAALALLAAAAGCNEDKSKASSQPLTIAAFKNKAAGAIITGSDLAGEPGFGSKVDVSAPDSLNTFSVPLEQTYASYRRDPTKIDAVLARFVAQTKARMERGNAGQSFAEARSLILPILKPKGVFRRLSEQPVATPFPGDLRVAYAVQRPDSFTLVTGSDLTRWQRSAADIYRLALANLVKETHRAQPLKCEQKLCGWASGDGYDAARFIVPELRQEIVRRIGPAVYAVPRESVYVALPIKLADRIREKVVRDFVTAPNPVSRDLFVERGGKLVVLSE